MRRAVKDMAMRLWGTTYLVSILLCAGAHGAEQKEFCGPPVAAEAFHFALPADSDAIEDPAFPGRKLYAVGKGNSGQVFRVEYQGEIEGYAKGYRTIKRGWDRETLMWNTILQAKDLRNTDLAVLTHMRAHQTEGRDLGFEVPEVEAINLPEGVQSIAIPEGVGIFFKLKIRGRDVFRISQDQSVAESTRNAVVLDYQRRLEIFRSYVNSDAFGPGYSQAPKRDDSLHDLGYVEKDATFGPYPSGNRVMIHTAADGVIVDHQTLAKFLVDPS